MKKVKSLRGGVGEGSVNALRELAQAKGVKVDDGKKLDLSECKARSKDVDREVAEAFKDVDVS